MRCRFFTEGALDTPLASCEIWNRSPLPNSNARHWHKTTWAKMAKKRANTRPDDFRTHNRKWAFPKQSQQHVERFRSCPRKQKTGSGYDSPTAHGDVTNLALFAKNRKSPFCDVIISVSFNHIRFILSGQWGGTSLFLGRLSEAKPAAVYFRYGQRVVYLNFFPTFKHLSRRK